jgi:hypothetical protein
MNRMVYVLAFGFMGLYLFGLWRHFGLTWALIYAGTGLLIVVPTVGYLVAGIIEGPDASWVRGWGLVGSLWAFFFLLLTLLTRPLQPTPAPQEKVADHDAMIATWATAGFSEWEAWLLRPGGKGVLFAFGQPWGQTVFVVYVEGPRSKTLAKSSLAGRTGMFHTTREAEGMLDLGELRQIVHGRDVEELLAAHEDGLRYLGPQGIAVDDLAAAEAMDFLVEDRRRSRAALFRFPVGFLGSFFRPILHVGLLSRRPGRHWQLDRLST